jgi:hypothetical protein
MKKVKRSKRLQPKLKLKAKPIIEAAATEHRESDLPSLVWNHTKPYFIAVCEHGFGVHQIVAAAIRIAQDSVPAKAKPSQLLIYRSADEVEPIGYDDGPLWPENGVKVKVKGKKGKTLATARKDLPKLAGLTTTHRLFVQTPRVV